MSRTHKRARSPSRQRVEHFREARLVRIAPGAFAIGLDPFGMLNPQIIVNLQLELGVSVDLVIHGYCLVKDSSTARDRSDKGLGGIADERWRRERTVRPGKGIPNGGTHVLAMCTTPGQLDYLEVLTFQQQGEQPALRKGLG